MRLEKLNTKKVMPESDYPISIVVNTELYGKVTTDVDGNQVFQVDEICAWIGPDSLDIPTSVLDKVTQKMQKFMDEQAIKAMEEEMRPF